MIKVCTIVFFCASVLSIGNEITNTKTILEQKKDFDKLAGSHYTQIYIASGSSDYLSELDRTGGLFYSLVDGVLIAKHDYENYEHDGTPTNEALYVNCDYLNNINPIIDTNGNKVEIDEADIADNELIVLVPEKYKDRQDEVYSSFYESYKFSRYVSVPESELPESERTVTIKLIYVKNDQTYFACNTDPYDLSRNYIKDPYVGIITKKNIDPSYHATYLMNSDFFIYDNENQTLDDIMKAAIDSGISRDLTNLPTVESTVDEVMQECKTKIIAASAVLVLTVLIVGFISIYIVRNYIERNKKLIFVKKTLGYSAAKIFGKIILLISAAEAALFIALKFALSMPITEWLTVSACFIAFDLILMSLTAFISSKALTKGVLKGE